MEEHRKALYMINALHCHAVLVQQRRDKLHRSDQCTTFTADMYMYMYSEQTTDKCKSVSFQTGGGRVRHRQKPEG